MTSNEQRGDLVQAFVTAFASAERLHSLKDACLACASSLAVLEGAYGYGVSIEEVTNLAKRIREEWAERGYPALAEWRKS